MKRNHMHPRVHAHSCTPTHTSTVLTRAAPKQRIHIAKDMTNKAPKIEQNTMTK